MALAESSSVLVSHRGMAFVGREADRAVIWLRGEHDISTVAELSETMARAMALGDADLVLDLSEVRFLGAATVGVIIRARNFLRPLSRSLALRSPSRCARRVLDLCGLADLLDPGSLDATSMTGAAGALGTWVAVPATDRVGRPAGPSAPKTHSAEDPARVDRVIAARGASLADDDLAARLATNVARRRRR